MSDLQVNQERLITKPVITKETKVIKHEPVITRESPVVYEKSIIHEKAIITERTIIHSEQPIIIEKPELHERVVNEVAETIVKTLEPVIRREEGVAGEFIEGNAVVHSETEYVQDQPVFNRETPIVHQKDVILEKPIIHEKDIIYREKPVIIEKPEIVEKHVYETHAPERRIHETQVFQHEEFTTEKPIVDSAIVNIEEPVINRAEPEFKKELPDVHETEVIHEKRLILEKPIVHTEKEVIHEKPEVHERTIFHTDQTLLKRDPLVQNGGIPEEGMAARLPNA